MENAIVIVVNQSFAHYAKPLINSIQKNWTNHPAILLFMSPDVTAEMESRFAGIPKVIIKRFDPKQYAYRKLLLDGADKFDSSSFNDAGFFIVNFWDETFPEYDNLLFLDADMLVLKNLDKVFEKNDFMGVSAANGRAFPIFSFNQPLLQKSVNLLTYYAKALAMGIVLRPHVSLNSGLVRISKADRTKSKFNVMLKLLKTFRKACLGDQEIITIWMSKYGKKLSYDFRMNFQVRFYNGLENHDLPQRYYEHIKKAAEDVHVIHFNGPKPDSPEFLGHPWTKGRKDLVELYQSYLG
ncbi:glycosyltransferase [Mucilaginibacter lacusdianchii]|uniref:glycosyltransferase n=1 Tax=Mucilaginibacter lacusdianchii TaxID=2684211 RepID=UPI00131B0BE0|nr:glycosyltransferase [Mucilaginibacter sp. JXJ CY 39]